MKKQFSPSTIAIGAGIIAALAVSVFFAVQGGDLRKNRNDESKFLSSAYIISAKNIDFFVMKPREDYLETVWQGARNNIHVRGFVEPANENEGSAQDWLVFDEEITITPGERYVFPIPKIQVQGAFTFSAIPVDDQEVASRQQGDELPERLQLSHFLFDEEDVRPVTNAHFPIFEAIEREIAEENRIRKQGAEKTPAQKEPIGMKMVTPENTCIDRNGNQIPCGDEQPGEPANDISAEFMFFFNEDNETLLRSALGIEPDEDPSDTPYSEEFFMFFDPERNQELLLEVISDAQREGALNYWYNFGTPPQNPEDTSSSVLKFLDEALVIS